jgi:hypothetical protein
VITFQRLAVQNDAWSKASLVVRQDRISIMIIYKYTPLVATGGVGGEPLVSFSQDWLEITSLKR